MPVSKKRVPVSPQKEEAKKEYVELRIPKFSKAGNVVTYLLIIGVIGLAFLAGSLWTKVQYLEQGGAATTVTTPTNAQEAFVAYAKQLKLDTNKFQACLQDGKNAARVTAQTQEGDTLGVRATPAFYINGKLIGGAFPYEAFKNVIDKELDGTGSEDYTQYADMLRQAYEDPNNRGFEPVAKQITIGDAPIQGNANAKVTIVEFSDFQCPFCARAIPTINQIMNDYKNDVRLVYKHFPINSIHPNAQKAAEASECAREQDKFWEYHDILFNNQAAWSNLPLQSAPAA